MNTGRYPNELRGPVRDAIVAAIRDAYDQADETYAPDRGRGDHLHGLTVYHVATHNLRVAFEDYPGAAFLSRGRGPEIHLGPHRVRWNKVGRGGEAGGIHSRFPRGSRAAAVMADENQMRLFDEASFESDGMATNWIVAHLGNPIDHLVAIYLCSPIESNGRTVTGWRDVVPIWSAADPDAEFPEAPEPGLPDPVELEELRVELRDDEDTAAAKG